MIASSATAETMPEPTGRATEMARAEPKPNSDPTAHGTEASRRDFREQLDTSRERPAKPHARRQESRSRKTRRNGSASPATGDDGRTARERAGSAFATWLGRDARGPDGGLASLRPATSGEAGLESTDGSATIARTGSNAHENSARPRSDAATDRAEARRRAESESLAAGRESIHPTALEAGPGTSIERAIADVARAEGLSPAALERIVAFARMGRDGSGRARLRLGLRSNDGDVRLEVVRTGPGRIAIRATSPTGARLEPERLEPIEEALRQTGLVLEEVDAS